MPRRQFTRTLLDEPLRRLVQEADRTDHAERETPAHTGLVVGAADDRAEREADDVAARVLARLGTPESGGHHEHDGHDHAPAVRRTPDAATIGAAGGALDAGSSAAIESARGSGSALPTGVRREMEAGFGQSLGDVRVHTDARAADLSRGMSARAFTTGRDIFFDQGEFSPGTAEGKRVLAHEIAHTRQDGGVHRKLRGTAQALESQGGGKTSSVLGKVNKSFITHWDRIVKGVRHYEDTEAALLSSGKNPGPEALMQAKTGLLRILSTLQAHVADWRLANDDEKENKKQKEKAGGGDSRAKAGRRQAINMLVPRLNNEMALLSSPDAGAWTASLGLADSKQAGLGADKRGGVNSVKEITYALEGAHDSEDGVAFTGYFKSDKGYHDVLDWEDKSGIKSVDPNYGARSVALYRLDKLLGADVTARAEFAVRTDPEGRTRMGTVLESAKGAEANTKTFGFNAGHAKEMGPGAIDLEDPVLQRSLNKLQILDVIAGQLDRHAGNYFIDSDEQTGEVRGVTGIDLDMAFGSDFTGITQEAGNELGARNYRGMPDYVDREFAQRLLQVTPFMIKDALTGLLSPPEVAATIARFVKVQAAVKKAQDSGQLVDTWDASTAGRDKVSGARMTSRDQGMRHQRDNLQFENLKHANAIALRVLGESLKNVQDDEVRRHLTANLTSAWDQRVIDGLLNGFQDHELTPTEMGAVARMFASLVNGPGGEKMLTASRGEQPWKAVDVAGEPLMKRALQLVVAKRQIRGKVRGRG